MGMDIHRGMPLPLFACLDASGHTATLRDAVVEAQAEDHSSTTVFCDRFTLGAILFAQSITSRISRKELAYWRSWTKQNAARAVDVAADPSDWAPGIVHALSEAYLGLRAILRFFPINAAGVRRKAERRPSYFRPITQLDPIKEPARIST